MNPANLMKHQVTTKKIVRMGNNISSLCASNNNNKRGGAQPPRDLTSLVEELVLTEPESGAENVWATQFRSFLKQRDKSLESALDFVTLSSKLSTVQDQAKNTDNKAKQEELKMKKVSLMSQMGEKYFKTESDQCLPLANQELHKELTEKLSKVNEKTSDAEMDDVYELVMMARSDNKLWKSGLDSSYKTFIANKPSANMKAVLLSIL